MDCQLVLSCGVIFRMEPRNCLAARFVMPAPRSDLSKSITLRCVRRLGPAKVMGEGGAVKKVLGQANQISRRECTVEVWRSA